MVRIDSSSIAAKKPGCVHVMTPDGTAKFWLEPIVALADHYRLNPKELSRLEAIVRDRQDDFIDAWRRHFGG
jgi:hypothetical protein